METNETFLHSPRQILKNSVCVCVYVGGRERCLEKLRLSKEELSWARRFLPQSTEASNIQSENLSQIGRTKEINLAHAALQQILKL